MVVVWSRLVVDRAQPSDATAVEELLDAAAAWQQTHGIRQWTPGLFREEVHRAIADASLYVARREVAVVGCFMLDEGSPRMTQWLIEHGREPRNGLNVGRLAVARQAIGQGLGVELLNAASRLAARQGIAYLWLDCPADNTRLRRFYVEAGFTYCGDNDIFGPNGEPWVSSVFERVTELAESPPR
jgi:ribosomal protein S18 acetylase RimI-like enzyme